jgi:hypothetical protein
MPEALREVLSRDPPEGLVEADWFDVGFVPMLLSLFVLTRAVLFGQRAMRRGRDLRAGNPGHGRARLLAESERRKQPEDTAASPVGSAAATSKGGRSV